MTAPAQKSLGQIAYEASYESQLEGARWKWEMLAPRSMADYERIANAVALECAQICLERARHYLEQAQGGDTSGAFDHKHHAALECAAVIREVLR